jgi:DNA-binding transcriptional MerR regulator
MARQNAARVQASATAGDGQREHQPRRCRRPWQRRKPGAPDRSGRSRQQGPQRAAQHAEEQPGREHHQVRRVPERSDSGYRSYDTCDLHRVRQIRGLLDSGLTTEIIRRILPFLTEPGDIQLPPQCLTAETARLLSCEVTRLQQRIDCLTRNRDALVGYLAAILPAQAEEPPD